MKKKISVFVCLLSLCIGFMSFNVYWRLVDPFNKYTDSTPLVYILDNSYCINRRVDKLDPEVIGDQIGTVKRKTLLSPNRNGESNHLEKGIELFEIRYVDNLLKIAVLYENEYYEYIVTP